MSALAEAVRRHLGEVPQPPVWSLIVTVFGDMAQGRGGALSTEALIQILGLVDVSPPAVRTALSRLVADGWLEGTREGRKSSYRMTQAAESETLAASRRIYTLPREDFDGQFEIALLIGGTAGARQSTRERLLAAGFGAVQPECLVRPAVTTHDAVMPMADMALFKPARLADDQALALVAAAYDLALMAKRHGDFVASFGGIMAAAAAAGSDGETVLAARLLLIHGWRRLALRDPGLPVPLQPLAMREMRVAQQVAAAYRRFHAASTGVLDDVTGQPASAQHNRFNRDI
jgi:phenylacetic acid degradation operon negative regulatory protein